MAHFKWRISAFYPMLSIAELIEFNADKKQIDDYLAKHEIENCMLYLDELSVKALGITKDFYHIEEVLNYQLYTLEELCTSP